MLWKAAAALEVTASVMDIFWFLKFKCAANWYWAWPGRQGKGCHYPPAVGEGGKGTLQGLIVCLVIRAVHRERKLPGMQRHNAVPKRGRMRSLLVLILSQLLSRNTIL